jgi:hypothetical protein
MKSWNEFMGVTSPSKMAGEGSSGFPWFWTTVLATLGYMALSRSTSKARSLDPESPDELVARWYAKNGVVPSADLVGGFTGMPTSYWVGKRVGGHILRRA